MDEYETEPTDMLIDDQHSSPSSSTKPRWSSRSMQAHRQMALVCRDWWIMNIRGAYSYVYLHHAWQLVLLLKTLDSEWVQGQVTKNKQQVPSQSRPWPWRGRFDPTSAGYDWIQHVVTTFTVPEGWKQVYSDGLFRLLECCPNLVLLSINAASSSISWSADEACHSACGGPNLNKRSSRMKHILIGDSALIPLKIHDLLIASFDNITTLELPFRAPSFAQCILDEHPSNNQAQPVVCLPSLQNLKIVVTPGERINPEFQVMGPNWQTPDLRCLFVVFKDAHNSRVAERIYQQDVDIVRICQRHGGNLRQLLVEEKVGRYFSSCAFYHVFMACPKLVDIAVPCLMSHLQQPAQFSTEDRPVTFGHTHLRRLKIFLVKRLSYHPIDDVETAFIHLFASSTSFPALGQVDIVRIAPRDYRPRSRPRKYTIRSWAEAFGKKNTCIKFTVFKDGRIVPLNVQHGPWEGEVDDDNDDDPDSGSDSDSPRSDSGVKYDSKVSRETTCCCSRRKKKKYIEWQEAVDIAQDVNRRSLLVRSR